MNSSPTAYHSSHSLAHPVDGNSIAYDDFELNRRKWADERLRLQITNDVNLTTAAQVSSLATLDGLDKCMDRELRREYRKLARMRGESDHAYEALQVRLEAVKSRLSIQEYVEATSPRTVLSVRGPRLVGLCPYHVEKSPSFVIYPDEHAWCFGCQRGGDLFDVIGLIEGMDRFYDQLCHAERFLGITPVTQSSQAVTSKSQSGAVRSTRPSTFEPIKIGPNGRVLS